MTQLKLKDKYKKIVPELIKKFNYRNSFQAPRLIKVVVSRGVSDGGQNAKSMEAASRELADITGQKPKINKAKKSIAAFKLRAGDEIGCTVTMRGQRMYLFLNKLINLALPKVRDFNGLNPRSFDGRGSYSFGIKEQLIFPEVDYDRVDKVRGMNITIHTSAKTDDEALELLKCLGGVWCQWT